MIGTYSSTCPRITNLMHPFFLFLLISLVYAESPTCVTSLIASSSSNSTFLDVRSLCPSGTLYYQCTITTLTQNPSVEFYMQAAFDKESLSLLPLCRIVYAGSIINSSSGVQVLQQGAIDPCWSPVNFTGWGISFVSNLQDQSDFMWNFTIGQSPSLEVNASNIMDDFFAVNHTYSIDLSSIELHHHSISLNLELSGPSGVFLPQVVVSNNPCAAVSHSAQRFVFQNQSASQHTAVLSGLLARRYYLTFTRDLRTAFPPAGQLVLTPVADPTGAPPRPFYLQLWFGGAVGIGLLVLVMLAVTRAAVAQPFADYAALKI